MKPSTVVTPRTKHGSRFERIERFERSSDRKVDSSSSSRLRRSLFALFTVALIWSSTLLKTSNKFFESYQFEWDSTNSAGAIVEAAVVIPCSQPVPSNDSKDILVRHEERKDYRRMIQLDYNNSNRTVEFLSYRKQEIGDIDRFSSMWWWKIADFNKFNLSIIGSIEGTSFDVFNRGAKDCRMTVNWLDFSVEHLSKWWKMLGPDNLVVMKRVLDVLENYINKLEPFFEDQPVNPITQQTIAVVPINSGDPMKTFALTATLASLWQIGIGRAIVFGDSKDEKADINSAFQLLNEKMSMYKNHPPMELAFSFGRETSWVIKRKHTPKAALHGLQDCLLGIADARKTKLWLGDSPDARTRWKYVYMTEPDLLLVTRPSALPALTAEVQKEGTILSAHRLQPLPHESDLHGYNDLSRYMPSSYKEVISLDHYAFEDSCCDGGRFKPGFKPQIPPCGGVWSYCGFKKPSTNYSDPAVLESLHKRLKQYYFIRLTRGSGLVIAGTNHGRRCFPQHNGTCTKRSW